PAGAPWCVLFRRSLRGSRRRGDVHPGAGSVRLDAPGDRRGGAPGVPARLRRVLPDDAREMRGRELRIPGGIIHEWSGSVVIRGISVHQLVEALTTPGTPPAQDDVIESRVLAKSGDALRVFLKLRRTAIVTVTYDTEHDVTFTRHTPSFASSRSVATSIREAGGSDRGFLWRFNSYWSYRAVAGGVRVEVLSVSLSRDAPALVRPVALPLASRIARESMRRTLDAMRQFGESLAARRSRGLGIRD